jgi:hypothetical protein
MHDNWLQTYQFTSSRWHSITGRWGGILREESNRIVDADGCTHVTPKSHPLARPVLPPMARHNI